MIKIASLFFLVMILIFVGLAIFLSKNPSSNPTGKAFNSENSIPSAEELIKDLNQYRTSSGLASVRENRKFTIAAQNHADYLARTETKYFIGKYANLHKENPESPFHSKNGDTIGAGVIAWQYVQSISAVDSLMTAPFHAIGMLREHLKEVGFGSAKVEDGGYSPGSIVTNIAILNGLGTRERTKVITFPGANSIVPLNSFEGENPEPREACGKNYRKFTGLPIFVSLLHNPSKKIEVKLTWRNGNVLTEGSQLCVVTENNFISTDKIYGPAGKQIIRQENLVLIIPKAKLSEGSYRVEISEPSRPRLGWTFTYKVPSA
jgi:Cysteine-rich secretory protein family